MTTAVETGTERGTQSGRNQLRAGLRWCGSVLAWTFLLALLAVLAMTVVVPRVAGATPYTVLTGSMRPTYPPGSLLIVRPVEAATLGVGDVITYQLRSGQPAVVTHRITGVSFDDRGNHTFVTKGDANNTADAESVRAVQIRGQVWYAVPAVGYLTSGLTGRVRTGVLAAIVGALVIYALVMFGSAARERRRGRRADTRREMAS